MRTKRFILITTILTLLIAGPLLIGGLLLPVRYQDTFMGELPYKLSRLENAPGKRIIVIGGSGMAFAVDSALLEQEFPGYTAVNMGMYADLGVRFLLDLTENELREGDIVILSPEQHTQTLSCWFGARSALQGTDGNISMLRYVSREDLGTLIGALPGFTLEKLRFMSTGEHPEGEGIYRRNSFNEYGDIDSEMVSQNIMPEEYVRAYAAHAHKKGAEVYWYFCPANRRAVNASASPEDFYDFLYETLDFPILGDPANAVMDEAWFFDTDFHLNQSGRTVFTVQLIRDLKAHLGISTPTDIALPAPPALPASGGSVLTAGTWAGNTSVTEITVPADVVRIEDYAFSGCTNLRAIRLLSHEPSRVLVGEHLLDGCGAYLLVPEGTLSAYRTDYRFSRYSDRIREST